VESESLHQLFHITLLAGADTGGDASPTRPKKVLTWHLISLKIIAKY